MSLGRFDDLKVDRLELVVPKKKPPWLHELLADLAAVSPETVVRLHPLHLRDPWNFDDVFSGLLDLALELDFEPEDVDLLVNITTGTHVAQICLFLLTEAGYLPGKLLQLGPPRRPNTQSRDGRSEAAGSWNVIDLDLSRYDPIATRFHQAAGEARDVLKSGIATRSAEFNRLIAQIEKVAAVATDPILLAGPTGAGKSLLAKRIYELRRARQELSGPFVEVNCATLRGDGAMSSLFGHKAGAFTGAVKDRAGLLRSADGGILFLDEIGELGLDEQAMLLRAIEDKRFLPVGSDQEVQSDFQLIAGSNRDLRDTAHSGGFREDLLARINMWTFQLPGLVDRTEDIEPNLDYELQRLERAHGKRLSINREGRDAFLAFAASPAAVWSGNFRDLNAAVRRMATLAPRGRIDEGTVQEEIERLLTSWSGSRSAESSRGAALIEACLGDKACELDRFERVQLAEVLSVCSRSRTLSEAGRQLFEVSRQRRKVANDADRLRKYLLRYDLRGPDVLRSDHTA